MGTWDPELAAELEADRRLKAIREQTHLGPLKLTHPVCPGCGAEVFFTHHTDDDWFPQLCTGCLLRRLKYRAVHIVHEEMPARKRCNRCLEERELIGAWCYGCRDAFQWSYILELIETANPTVEQKVFLANVAPHWAAWRQHEDQLRAWGVWVDPPVVRPSAEDADERPSAA